MVLGVRLMVGWADIGIEQDMMKEAYDNHSKEPDMNLIMQVADITYDLAMIDVAEHAMEAIRSEGYNAEIRKVHEALEYLRESIELNSRQSWSDLNAG
jgi:hypothetical protein